MVQRILMVEDDEALASMVSDYLAEHGYALTLRHDIATGLGTFRNEDFDAVILDLMLPDGNGLDVCREIRSESDVPVLMLTARGDELDRIVGLELGADDYLPKPFNPRELLARVRAVLRRRPSTPELAATSPAGTGGELRFGRLLIEPDARHVSVDGRACELTSYQFDLLHAMAERAGRVLSRDALMNALRGHDVGAFDRTIDVHISRIRAEIEDDPRKPRRIITVRGAGYVFAREQDAGL